MDCFGVDVEYFEASEGSMDVNDGRMGRGGDKKASYFSPGNSGAFIKCFPFFRMERVTRNGVNCSRLPYRRTKT